MRLYQSRQNVGAWDVRPGGIGSVIENGPEGLAHAGRKHAVEIFERRPAQRRIVCVKAAVRDPQRL